MHQRIRITNPTACLAGSAVAIRPYAFLNASGSDGTICLGAHSMVGEFSILNAAEAIEVGKDTLIAPGAVVRDDVPPLAVAGRGGQHGSSDPGTRHRSALHRCAPAIRMVPTPMPEQVRCNLCGADDTELIYRARDHRLGVDEIEWPLVRCRRCGLGYLNPRPTSAEIGKYYPERYFAGRENLGDRYERQAGYLPQAPGRLLDIGTAGGDFAALMQERGWTVEGIENAEAAENPHGLLVHRMSFPEEADRLSEESYDVITAWAVFEHLRDPRRAFEASARMLRPGGRLIIQVPNLRSVWARHARNEDIPRHLYFFTPTTLGHLGSAAGLKLRHVHHTTDLFGGSGRGALRLLYVRALGGSITLHFKVLRTPRRERWRRWPLMSVGWTAVAALEKVILADRLVRAMEMSGQIVVEFERPPS
jgi:SAM-dependent methyltransferase